MMVAKQRFDSLVASLVVIIQVSRFVGGFKRWQQVTREASELEISEPKSYLKISHKPTYITSRFQAVRLEYI